LNYLVILTDNLVPVSCREQDKFPGAPSWGSAFPEAIGRFYLSVPV